MPKTLEVVYKFVDELIPYVNNARVHSPAQIHQIAASIQEFGFNNPVLIDKDNGIIAGHGRLVAAKKIGMTQVPTICLDKLSKAQKKAYILADNKIAENATWDNSLLQIEFSDLMDLNFDLDITGFADQEVTAILNPAIEQSPEDMLIADEGNKTTEKSVSKPGDLWILGHHRLICGDPGNPDHLIALIEKNYINLLVTDATNLEKLAKNTVQGDLDTLETNVFSRNDEDEHILYQVLSMFQGNVAYIWHHPKDLPLYISILHKNNFEIISQIILPLHKFKTSRADYQQQHESCLYAVRKNQKHNWTADNMQSTLWDIHDRPMNPDAKPLECMSRAISNNSKVGDFVFDPFAREGNTLIAAELLERKALIVEQSPSKCDAIIKHWQKRTKKDAILSSVNRSFAQVKNDS